VIENTNQKKKGKKKLKLQRTACLHESLEMKINKLDGTPVS
jgi:hypothetical protein